MPHSPREERSVISTLERAWPQIHAALVADGKHVFSPTDIRSLLATRREEWSLAQSTREAKFRSFLLDHGFRAEQIRSERYGAVVRLIWDSATPYEVASSLRTRSYFSHASAVYLHALNDQLPKTIYVNQEQTAKPRSFTPLSQESLRTAFSRRQRVSEYVFAYAGHKIILLSGKNTGRLGVELRTTPDGAALPVTNIERTLIDIAVRPNYSGGIVQVLEAYRGAVPRASIPRLAEMLRELDYTYPYHQAIGFLLERAGAASEQLKPLRAPGLRFDYYLVHGAKQLDYDRRWRLFFPKGL